MPCHLRDALIRQTHLTDPNLLTLTPQWLSHFKSNCSNYFNNLPLNIQSAINNRITPPAPQHPTPQPAPAAQPMPSTHSTNIDEEIDYRVDKNIFTNSENGEQPSDKPSGPKRKF